MEHIFIVLGILRTADELLMIQQANPVLSDFWSVPGGMVEEGERLDLALKREVFEESGLEVLAIDKLAFYVQFVRPWKAQHMHIYAFEIASWQGECCVTNDPDVDIIAVEWTPMQQALERLIVRPFPALRDPLFAYISNQVVTGTTWIYEQITQADPHTLLAGYPNNMSVVKGGL